jgi:hypothetical protein
MEWHDLVRRAGDSCPRGTLAPAAVTNKSAQRSWQADCCWTYTVVRLIATSKPNTTQQLAFWLDWKYTFAAIGPGFVQPRLLRITAVGIQLACSAALDLTILCPAVQHQHSGLLCVVHGVEQIEQDHKGEICPQHSIWQTTVCTHTRPAQMLLGVCGKSGWE